MDALGVVTLTAATSTITFSSIPATYTNLHLRGIARSTNAGTGSVATNVFFNSDTTATDYYSHQLYGSGTNPGGSSYQNGASFGFVIGQGGNTAGIFGTFYMDILDYTNVNKYKVTRCISGADTNSTAGFLNIGSIVWKSSAAAVNAVSFTITNGSNFDVGTSFALYGVK